MMSHSFAPESIFIGKCVRDIHDTKQRLIIHGNVHVRHASVCGAARIIVPFSSVFCWHPAGLYMLIGFDLHASLCLSAR